MPKPEFETEEIREDVYIPDLPFLEGIIVAKASELISTGAPLESAGYSAKWAGGIRNWIISTFRKDLWSEGFGSLPKSTPRTDIDLKEIRSMAEKIVLEQRGLEWFGGQLPDDLMIAIRAYVVDIFDIDNPDELKPLKEPVRVLDAEQQGSLLSTLKTRFEEHPERHEGVEWARVERSLEAQPEIMWSIQQLEESGGEPDVFIIYDDGSGFAIGDCSKESPSGRRNTIYDGSAEVWLKRQGCYEGINGNVTDMELRWGVNIMSREQYAYLHSLGEFDLETRSRLNSIDIRRGKVARVMNRSWLSNPDFDFIDVRYGGSTQTFEGRRHTIGGKSGAYVERSNFHDFSPDVGFRCVTPKIPWA
ncbi:DUF4256 domain-containing protein [Patescibacteria group bacterium]|nr:DUF4256 domain-containing protein [Patescibacteria group bacterium]MBU1682887.1 DUF4256 domain-containing protein [Patescibacteria group bacterium]